MTAPPFTVAEIEQALKETPFLQGEHHVWKMSPAAAMLHRISMALQAGKVAILPGPIVTVETARAAVLEVISSGRGRENETIEDTVDALILAASAPLQQQIGTLQHLRDEAVFQMTAHLERTEQAEAERDALRQQIAELKAQP